MNRAAWVSSIAIVLVAACASNDKKTDNLGSEVPIIAFEDHDFEKVQARGWSAATIPGELNVSDPADISGEDPDFELSSSDFIYIGRLYAAMTAGERVECEPLKRVSWMVTFTGAGKSRRFTSDGSQVHKEGGECLATDLQSIDFLD